jgi:hypothetical protein
MELNQKKWNYISHINTFRAFPRILTAAPGSQLWGTIHGYHWPMWNTPRREVGGHLPEKVSSWEVDLRFGTGSEIFGDLSKIHDICVAWDQRLWDFFCVQLRFVFSWDWMSLCNFKCQFAIWTQPAAPENMFLQEINPPSTPLKLLVLNYCCGYLRGRSLLTSIVISV